MRRNIETHRLDVLRNITDLLGRTFSSQFVFPVLGHEDGQGNNFRRLGELWRHWLPSEALQTFEKGKKNNCEYWFFVSGFFFRFFLRHWKICVNVKKKIEFERMNNRNSEIKKNNTQTQMGWTYKRLFCLNCTYTHSTDNPDWFHFFLSCCCWCFCCCCWRSTATIHKFQWNRSKCDEYL